MKSAFIFIAHCLSLSAAITCPLHWESFQDSCYTYVNDITTWTGAQTVCNLLGGHLVEIESADENAFLVAQMAKQSVSKVWMGLNDFVMEGEWVWTSSREQAEYFNWAPNEPNDDATNPQLGDQDCGAIYSTGLWDDEYCETTHHLQFFCERTARGAILG